MCSSLLTATMTLLRHYLVSGPSEHSFRVKAGKVFVWTDAEKIFSLQLWERWLRCFKSLKNRNKEKHVQRLRKPVLNRRYCQAMFQWLGTMETPSSLELTACVQRVHPTWLGDVLHQIMKETFKGFISSLCHRTPRVAKNTKWEIMLKTVHAHCFIIHMHKRGACNYLLTLFH